MAAKSKTKKVSQTSRLTKIMPKITRDRIYAFVIVLLILGLAATGYLLYQEMNRTYDPIAERDQMLERVSKILLLPEGSPNMTIITNSNDLKEENPEFFENAVDGDVLFVYEDTAIIYREEEHKIINIAPVFLDQKQQGSELPEQNN